MMQGLLWVLGVFALSVAMTHLLWGKFFRRPEAVHFILVSRNNERQIEWVIRSILSYCRLHGKNLHITLLDLGSTDDTLRIARTLFQRHIGSGKWRILSAENGLKESLAEVADGKGKVIRLNEIGDWRGDWRKEKRKAGLFL